MLAEAITHYLSRLRQIRSTGEAAREVSYYGALEQLLNALGGRLSPRVSCVLNPRRVQREAGTADLGLFTADQLQGVRVASAWERQTPARGVVEVKGPGADLKMVATSEQVGRYLATYGRVLVTNLRGFQVVRLDARGERIAEEPLLLADSEEAFWQLISTPAGLSKGLADRLADYLLLALSEGAPVMSPQQLAWFLATYARSALEVLGERTPRDLGELRRALERAVGVSFSEARQQKLFRSTLIQTLFYSVFAAWVLWARRQPSNSQATFDWRTAGWELDVPVVRALFDRIGTRGTLGRLGLIEQLDRAGETLNRVDRPAFFDRFATAGAVEYFYEPFLAAFDPELRKELGVWFTPQEVVHYMVDKIDRTLRSDFNFELGLADPRVTVLDPCAGTGSFLLAVLERIHRTLASRSPDPLVPGEVKQAALQRLFGFELLPAPLVISHLQLGLRLRDLGAPLDSAAEERVRVYLTNSLVGWQDSAAAHATIPIPEFEQEWDAATGVKQRTRILVVIGNPPYNAFAGVSPAQEADLLDEYKQGVVTRNTLDDLYVRFLRVAQLRIARRTGQGIVCLITNSSYLAAPSFKSMRTSLLGSFDRITVDNLNGDRDATRKRTPDGRPDPSIFSTPSNPAGIAEGTAIATYVRLPARSEPRFASVRHRDFWGTEKRPELAAAAENGPAYEQVIPSEDNFYALRPIRASNDYYSWPSVTDLAATDPVYGLHEARGGGLFSFEREPLAERMRVYLNADVPDDTLPPELAPLHRAWFGFDPARVRARLTGRGADAADARPFEERKLRRFLYKPCDLRWAYVEPTRGLWVAPQPQLLRAADHGARFLYVRRTAENARPDPPLLLSRHVGDQHALHKTAYLLPTLTVDEDRRTEGAAVQLTAFDHGADKPTATSNLSAPAREYLRAVGRDPEHLTAADELWLHVMAVAFAPGYFRAFTEAMSQAYPRVPLPADGTVLEQSISLGRRITNLLEPVDAGDPALAGVAALGRPATKDHGPIDPARDLEVTVRWGYRNAQGAIMPAAGSTRRRPRTAQEDAAYAQLAAAVNRDRDEIATLLGDEVMDIELNERVHLAGVPLHVWELQIGGFLVLKKWLSYRTRELLARPLRPEELRSLANIARRLAVVVALRPELDENFATVRSDPWPWPVG